MLTLLAIFAVSTPALMAQSLVSGDVAGTVTDSSGAVVPGAAISLKNADTGFAQTTNANAAGAFRFSLLKPGVYTIRVAQKGFQSFERQVTVSVGQVSAANIALNVGKTSEVIQVTDEASLINTDQANPSTSFNQQAISMLPNGGGDLTNVAQSAPGVVMNVSAGYGNFTANGLPATANVFTMNGENNMDPYFNINNSGATNLTLGNNEVGEATVVTSPYSGQYGQQAGAQVNYVTKSGTNSFHGNASYLWNGRVMNANDWFANHDGKDRPFANNNQWATSFGGPIRKDKTFFFVDYEGLRYVLPTAQNVKIPTQAYKDRTLANVAANHPAELALYQKLFNVWLSAPGAETAKPISDDVAQFVATPGQLSTEWILAGRVDQNIGSNDRVFFRYHMDRGNQATETDPINSAFNATSFQPSYDGQMQWTRTIGTNMTNQFIMAGSYYRALFTQDKTKSDAVFPYAMTFSYGDFTDFGWAYRYPQGRNVTQYQFIDDFSAVKGNHTFKAGMNFRRYDVSDFNFTLYSEPRLYVYNIDRFASGVIDRWRQRFATQNAQPVAMYGLGLYAEDEWKVAPDFKLTLALRAEHNSNPVCQTGCVTLFNGAFEDLQHGTTIPYNQNMKSGLHQAYVNADNITWSPRVGFTWSPFHSEKTVFSGGFGLFYDALPSSMVESFAFNPPGLNEFSVKRSLWADPGPNGAAAIAKASNAALLSGFAAGKTYADIVAATGGVFAAPSIYNIVGPTHTPQFQEWNFQVQQSLTSKTSLTLNYFGTHGIHIPIDNYGLNAVDDLECGAYPDYGQPCGAGFPAAQLDESYGTIQQYSTSAVSNSNGLTGTFQGRFGHGFTAQASYTWSHALDEISNGGVNPYGNDSLGGQINPWNLRANYGNADYDVRHSLSAYFVWALPFQFSNRAAKNALSGWTLSSKLFGRSGLPYTVLDGNAAFTNYPGSLVAQPLGSGAAPGDLGCSSPLKSCLDSASFVDASVANFPGYATFPTQRRNQYRGPKFFNMDFSMSKNLKLTEKVGFSLGANFYNVLNHPNFANPDYNVGSATFGYIQSTVSVPASPYGSFVGAAASGRIIQLQGKISF